MRNRYNLAVVLSAVVLVCCGALILGQGVNAAGEGKITGTVKLDGAAPHMKGIDMSKDPYCSKAHASDPAHLETYVVGANGGLENVVLYISDWSGSAQVSTAVLEFNQKNCMYTPHVLAMDVGESFKVATSDQTAHNIHPNPNPMTGNIPVESVSAAGCSASREELESYGVYRSEVQYPSLDARLVRCGQRALRDHRRERHLHHQQRAARKLHRDRVAGSRRYPNPKSDGCRRQAGNCGFHI